MRIDAEENVIVFDNLLEAEREFGKDVNKVTIQVPAEKAVVANAVGTFPRSELADTHKRAILSGAAIKSKFALKS